MSVSLYRTRVSLSARARSSRSNESSRPSSNCSVVESNFRLSSPDDPQVPEVIINRKQKRRKEITINDSPMMLLPKARVRDSLDYYDKFRRSYTVVADTLTQGLHISTIQSVEGLESRVPQKSVLKCRRNSVTRSEADSGFCSLKRTVTFDNLNQSQSSVFRSDEELDNFSDSSSDDREAEDIELRLPSVHLEPYPDHVDCFGDGEAVLPDPPSVPPRPTSRTGSASQKRRHHGESEYHDVSTCEICGTVLSDKDRVLRKFGKVDSFLDWVMSRWGPGYYERLRRELQYVPRPSYVYRNHTPHFCNFVHQISLHKRDTTEAESVGPPDSELGEDTEFILESAEGRLVSKYRNTSSTRTLSPLSKERVENVQNWLEDKKVGKNLLTKYFRSIPETKEDIMASGTEGRPGSPSSLDGDSRLDEDGMQQQPVTEVKVISPVKPEHATCLKSPRSAQDDKKPKSKPKPIPKSPKSDDRLSSRTNMSIPEEREDRLDGDREDKGWGSAGSNPELARGSKTTTKSVSGLSSSDSENRVPSPSQPLPSPEPQKLQKVPQEIPLPVTTAKKRGCASKKTKKPLERVRQKKEMELPASMPEKEKVEDKPADAVPVLESDKVDSKIDLKVPELPSTSDNKETPKKGKSKPKRHLIEAEDDIFKSDPTDLLNEQMKQYRAEFDWSSMETNGTEELKQRPQIKSWIQGRLALSQQASRFELPMDMKELEKMTPQDYIKKHCIITSRRANLYQKIFLKNKDKSQTILYKDLDRSLKDVLVNTITSEQVQEILRSLGVDENTKVEYKLFAGIAAFAERVLYPQFVTEDTHDMPEYQREKIECADFCALPWKLHGVNVNPDMRKLLEQIR